MGKMPGRHDITVGHVWSAKFAVAHRTPFSPLLAFREFFFVPQYQWVFFSNSVRSRCFLKCRISDYGISVVYPIKRWHSENAGFTLA
jgi:hypothetical protein